MEPLIAITIFASFFCSFLITPLWIRKAKSLGLTGKDIHKKKSEEVAEGGGVGILFGFTIGVLLYVAINTFYFNNTTKLTEIFALLCVIFIGSIVGIVDDLTGWKKGLSRKIRIAIVVFAAIPLMVINAGESSILGINLGIFFPLIVIPLGIVGATTVYNTLAGYNGLETSQGMLLLGALAYITYITGNPWLSVVALCMVAALLAFYFFNMNPAKIFPGDITTYSIGALFGGIAIIGNVEKIALFFFIPYIFEIILKIRGKLEKESFGKLNQDGESLDLRYNKIYGLEHLAIKILKKVKKSGKAYENEVVWLINGFQLLIIILGLLIFF